MADKGAQDKTEKPTPRRRSKAREKGQVAKSQELAGVGVLLAGLATLNLFGGYIYQQLSELCRHYFRDAAQMHLSVDGISQLGLELMVFFFFTVAPVFAAVVLAAVLVNLAQVGFLLSGERIKPDLKKINPLSGFKRWFSLRMLVDLAKNLGKLTVVGWVAYLTVAAEWDQLPRLGDMEIREVMVYIVTVSFRIFWRTVLAMLVIALLDWAYQKYEYEKNLRMSKQEIKDEFKQTEGDPQVKSRIRSIQRDQARKRMMAAIPLADVVVTNPTHYAVALGYKAAEMEAPTVLAKGMNRLAERIKEAARDNHIPVVEDPPLARALYKQVEVGQEIPFELYEATATLLAHIYRQQKRQAEVLAARPARA
ncbi:MAG: flagellar biosynthesis protein FlhB [Pseudomonadota bacterium]